ncbi:hypothetical protein [Neisseria sp. CCUG12390]|uniref:hypothetical protein n=1 Tax=Neisseria sp. CCUG12390 TaxID=3392035 RepID=UPI003A0FEB10
MAKFELFANRIEELHDEIQNYHHNLNMEAVFLFLASLGCYSVPNDWLKIIALCITFFLFTFNLINSAFNNPKFPNSNYHPWHRSFLKNIDYLEMTIDAAYPENTPEHSLLREKLMNCRELLSTKKLILGKSIKFLICFIFFWCVFFDILCAVLTKK